MKLSELTWDHDIFSDFIDLECDRTENPTGISV